MEEWNPQKILDLYIHDYMIRKNMHSAAETFAQEANVCSKAVAINPPEGFLTEWWSLFWDVFSAKLANSTDAAEGSSSQVAENMPQTVHPNMPMPMPMPMPDMDFMLQDGCPIFPSQGIPDWLQVPSESIIRRAEMDNFPHNVAPTIMPRRDMNLRRSGKAPVENFNFRQGETFTDFVAARMREQERLKLPATDVNSSNSRLFDVDQLARMLPAFGNSSSPLRKVNNNLQLPVARDDQRGTSVRRSIDAEPTDGPKLKEPKIEPADPGRAKMGNHVPFEGVGYTGGISMATQQQQFSGSAARSQLYSTLAQASQASGKLKLSSVGCSSNMGSPLVVDDGPNGNSLISGKKEELEIPMDEDVKSFFSNDEAPDDLGISFGTSQPSSSAQATTQAKTEQQGFPFELIGNLHPTTNKLSCCDFSTSGAFLAAGGHEKKVYIWNLKTAAEVTIQGHSQLITDIRFKPDSNIFATSSFDRSVQIWNAANPNRALFNLAGHDEHVVSLDFHPKKTNLLCSCDSNDVIRLWRVNQSACVHMFKGANGMLRFQPRLGNLLAAARGNVINLIDVETGTIQHQFQGHANDVHSLCWDVEGKCLVSVSEDSARIWSIVMGGNCVHQLYSGGNKFASCTFHPAYAQVVLVGSYQAIDIWNPTIGNKTSSYRAHNGIVSALSHASATNVIGSVSHDQCIRLWK